MLVSPDSQLGCGCYCTHLTLIVRNEELLQVLPQHVDAELAVKEGWWKNPDYILNELNVNSTISSPAHDERVYLDQNRPYTMKGYAYSGGGRKITRVEVSFDGGALHPCTPAHVWYTTTVSTQESSSSCS